MKKVISIDMQVMNELELTPTWWAFLDYLHDLTYAEVYTQINTKAVAKYLGLRDKDIGTIVNAMSKKGLVSISNEDSKLIRTTERWRSVLVYEVSAIPYTESVQHRARAYAAIAANKSVSPEISTASVPAVMERTGIALIERKRDLINSDKTAYLQDADRVVNEFAYQRKLVQPNFDINLCEGRYSKNAYDVMREHLYDTTHSRTPKHYFDALRWVFGSPSKEALFWKKSINSISKLIQHYDAIEIAAMSNVEDKKISAEMQTRIELLRENGVSEEAIQKEIKKMFKGDGR